MDYKYIYNTWRREKKKDFVLLFFLSTMNEYDVIVHIFAQKSYVTMCQLCRRESTVTLFFEKLSPTGRENKSSSTSRWLRGHFECAIVINPMKIPKIMVCHSFLAITVDLPLFSCYH